MRPMRETIMHVIVIVGPALVVERLVQVLLLLKHVLLGHQIQVLH